jgi:ribose-phosphate pyrophosphokinase
MLLSGNAHRELSASVGVELNIGVCDTSITRFSDGEISVKVNQNIRGSDVFVIQPTCTPVNDNIMELLLMIDALKRASAGRITAVIPYYGYGRQDRKVQPRVPISSKLIADLLTAAGTNRMLAVDLHAGQIQGFFNIPVDHLYAAPLLVEYAKTLGLDDPVVVSPDAGGVERARFFARRLNADLAIIDKRRERANVSEVMNVIGDVKGRPTILIDDMIDTAGTIVQAASALKEKGSTKVYASCTHAVLSGPAIERLDNSVIEELFVTDTLPLVEKIKQYPRLRVQSIAPMLAEAIKRIHEESSISSLFV